MLGTEEEEMFAVHVLLLVSRHHRGATMLSDGVGDSGTKNLQARFVDTCQSLQNKTNQKKTKTTKPNPHHPMV